jgi:hypothetical protein
MKQKRNIGRPPKRENTVERPVLWEVVCVMNPNVHYDVIGPIRPQFCPACGGKCWSSRKGKL